MLPDTLTAPLSRTLADEIVQRLTAAIMSGQLGPGERLNDEGLAKALGVSRGPLRDAFRQLEHQGLIVTQRNRGTYVARLQRQDVEEVYSLRLALERLAIQRTIRYADDRHFDDMQAKVDRMAEYATRGMTPQEAAELDLQFHDGIYQASQHRRLYECWTTLRPQIQIMFLSRNVANPDFRELNPLVHQELLDTLRARDAERAIAFTDTNLRLSYEHVVKSYPETDHEGQNGASTTTLQ